MHEITRNRTKELEDERLCKAQLVLNKETD